MADRKVVYLKDMVDRVADSTGELKGDVEKVLRRLVTEIGAALERGEEVRIVGLGVLGITEYPQRRAKHPRTGVEVVQPRCKVPTFRASATLKRKVRGG